MGEKVIVRQTADFATVFLATDPDQPAGPVEPVAHLHQLSPYGMVLAGLGSCTTILLHSYAANRALPLREVVVTLRYDRRFEKDCRTCETDGSYEEDITVDVELIGDLDRAARERLLEVSRHCPVEKILERGIRVTVRPASPEVTA